MIKIGCLNWLSIYYFYLTKVQTLPCPIQRTNNGDTKISIRAAVPIRHPAQPTPVLDRHAPDAYSRPNTLTLHCTSRPPSQPIPNTYKNMKSTPSIQCTSPPNQCCKHTTTRTPRRWSHASCDDPAPTQMKQPLTTRSVETYPELRPQP